MRNPNLCTLILFLVTDFVKWCGIKCDYIQSYNDLTIALKAEVLHLPRASIKCQDQFYNKASSNKYWPYEVLGSFAKAQPIHFKFCSWSLTLRNDVVLNVTTYRLTMILWSFLKQRFFIYKEQTLSVMICLVIRHLQTNIDPKKFLGSFAKAQMSLSMHWKFCSLSLTLWNDVVLNVATYRLTMISQSLLRQRFFIYKEQALSVMICVVIRQP